MQTFLPLVDFADTAKVLDRLRLGNQRSEAFMVMQALGGVESRWRHNPIVGMWKHCELTLVMYAVTICREWRFRGYEDNMEKRILEFTEDAIRNEIWLPGRNNHRPWWLGHDGFHLSHRSNLVRKDPEYYGAIWPDVSGELPYVWPEIRTYS